MHVGRIAGTTHLLGAPKNWDEKKQGHCGALPVRIEQGNLGTAMTSAWFPTPEEIAAIQAGAPIYLTIIGAMHPPVAMSVGRSPDDVPIPTPTGKTGEKDADGKGQNA